MLPRGLNLDRYTVKISSTVVKCTKKKMDELKYLYEILFKKFHRIHFLRTFYIGGRLTKKNTNLRRFFRFWLKFGKFVYVAWNDNIFLITEKKLTIYIHKLFRFEPKFMKYVVRLIGGRNSYQSVYNI